MAGHGGAVVTRRGGDKGAGGGEDIWGKEGIEGSESGKGKKGNVVARERSL